MDWLWIVAIVAASAIACCLIWVYSNRKKIFKKCSKQDRKAKKQEKKSKKEEKKAKRTQEKVPITSQPQEKQEAKLSFTEKQIDTTGKVQIEGEPFISSDESSVDDNDQYDQVARMRPRNMSRMRERIPFEYHDFDLENHQSIKEQLQSLTPEMKAIVFANLLDKRDDQF